MEALAEGTWLMANTEPGRYSHLSASMAIALALRSLYLFEQADELLSGIRLGGDHFVDLLVVQEQALMSAFWGTTLLVVGHTEAAAPHFVTCAERALRMGRVAARACNRDMSRRAEVIEAYGLSRLGYTDLAAARVRAVTQRVRSATSSSRPSWPNSSLVRQRRRRALRRREQVLRLAATSAEGRTVTSGRLPRWSRWPT